MSETLDFPSLTRNNVAYRLSADWPWDKRGDSPLSLHLTEFDTCGDGMTQHSGSYCTQFCQMADACISLAQAYAKDPLNEAWGQLPYIFHETGDEICAFVQTLKYREDKAQWYNPSERKVSSSSKCQHDRRWEKVESWMDGSSKACASLILLIGGKGCDWLGKLCLLEDLRKAMNYPLWEDMLPVTSELTGDWHQAFCAARAANRAYREMGYARRASESALGNTKRAEEKAA